MTQNYTMQLPLQVRAQAYQMTSIQLLIPVFACFGGDAWLLPAALMALTVIWYKVAALRPVTVPGELATMVSMTVSPSSAVRR